jgi:hypothetical protein
MVSPYAKNAACYEMRAGRLVAISFFRNLGQGWDFGLSCYRIENRADGVDYRGYANDGQNQLFCRAFFANNLFVSIHALATAVDG